LIFCHWFPIEEHCEQSSAIGSNTPFVVAVNSDLLKWQEV
jgi:hypothetical protein